MPSITTSISNSRPVLNEPADSGSATSKLDILSRLRALEMMVQDEMAAIRKRLDDNDQSTSNGQLFTNDNHDGCSNGTKGLGIWQSRGFTEIALSSASWKPLAVREMPSLDSSPLSQQPLPLENMKGFTLEELISVLGGEEWSSGVYYPAMGAKCHSKQLKHMMKSKTYYCMDAEFEPFLPGRPGQNGAKLTVFFRDNDTDTENMHQNVPLFVALPKQQTQSGERLYTYFGHYSQSRWSDKLDYDRVQEVVPTRVKQHWAEKLTETNRPGWLEHAIVEHFWPMPKYEGVVPSKDKDEGTSTVILSGEDKEIEESQEDLKHYMCELIDWKRESQMKVRLLKKENIIEAFAREDAAEEAGLRFWWEYLQCEGFDRNFYYLLATAAASNGHAGNLQTSTDNTM